MISNCSFIKKTVYPPLRPKKYVELLSDDGVNRQVLHWLKLWDGVVFGRKMREKAPAQKPKWATMEEFQRWQRNQEPEYDEKGFPFKKVGNCCDFHE